ncbi:MAG: hypothetical protein GY719_00780 [bacterium]|nr:hypothetical protein [bacterium]
MARAPEDDQLALFPGTTLPEAPLEVRPWRTALADDWRRGEVEPDNLEPFLIDLVRRDRELLRALKLAGVPEEAAEVQGFQRSEAPLIDHVVQLRRGEITEDERLALARAALEIADGLADLRRQILEGLDADQRERALAAEPRVRIHDSDLYRELAEAEFARAEEKGEIALPWSAEYDLPPGFLGLADVEAMAQHAIRAWKDEQDQRPLPRQLRLKTLLKGIPAIWLDPVCATLGIGLEGLKLRKDRERAVAQALMDADQLRRIVRDELTARERELVAFLLEKGGQVASGLVTRRFGRDDEDGWFWNEEPPTSVLGRVRLHGLAFVGRLPTKGRMVRTVAIPRELREPLSAVLEEESRA